MLSLRLRLTYFILDDNSTLTVDVAMNICSFVYFQYRRKNSLRIKQWVKQ